MTFNPTPATFLSIALVLVTLTPITIFISPLITLPTLRTLLPLFDHLTSAFFATRYLTFSTRLLPTDPQTLYPYILPYLPLLQLSAQLFTNNSIIDTILPFSKSPKLEYNPCQARFSIFLSTLLVVPLIILQAVYGVPRGVSHHAALLLPCLLIVCREGSSWISFVMLGLIAWIGNVAVLGYLIGNAVFALLNDVSLARLLLAPRGDWRDKDVVGDSVEEDPLLKNHDATIVE